MAVSSHELRVARPTALREQVVSNLRQAIISGLFPPGSRLIERQMCELVGVSRTLVREALRQLEAEGWILIVPNRGPIVASMTPSEVRDLYEVRAALEGVAAKRAAERATPELIAELERAVEIMKKAQKRKDSVRHREQVQIFYDVLREASGNAFLTAKLTAMSARMAWLRSLTLAKPERAAIALQDETRLLAAIKAGDGARARAVCEAGLLLTGEAVVAVLEACPDNPALKRMA